MSDETTRSFDELRKLTPKELRMLNRQNRLGVSTGGLAPGFAQANLVVLPKDYMSDFILFCTRNPKPCPLIEVMDVGDPRPKLSAKDCDIRTDIGKYIIYRDGVAMETVDDITAYWRDDLVGFIIGCSYTFENALMRAGIEVRHITNKANDPTYVTSVPCIPAGPFHATMAASMRPIHSSLVPKAVTVTAKYIYAHGAPIHVGNPELIGIKNIMKPEYGDSPEIRPGELPVFWACGVTPQIAAMQARLPFMMSHYSGFMFITDIPDEQLTAE